MKREREREREQSMLSNLDVESNVDKNIREQKGPLSSNGDK